RVLAALVSLPLGELGVEVETRWEADERGQHAVQDLPLHARRDGNRREGGRPLPLGRRQLRGPTSLVERLLQAAAETLQELLRLVHAEVAPVDQGFGVELADRAPGVDR